MDYRFTDEEESFRQEIREFLRAELPPEEEQGERDGTGFAILLYECGRIGPLRKE
ncbi:MAG: hypothetical protein ACE5FA_05755 [Dehalococcoidia bacterium]